MEGIEELDLPTFDLLFAEFVNKEFSIRKPEDLPAFIQYTQVSRFALTQEQLAKLVDLYQKTKAAIPPYSRFQSLSHIASIERLSASI